MATPRRRNLPEVRGLSEAEAADHCGFRMATFRRLVKTGVLPSPFPIGGRDRVYDLKAIDNALDRLSSPGTGLDADIRELDLELGCYDD